jgi:serine/threonine protein kinase
MRLSVGTRLGPYEIVARIGAADMGEVYSASDARLHRTVAVKVSSDQFSERFEHEARAVAAFNHSGICQIWAQLSGDGVYRRTPFEKPVAARAGPEVRRADL